MASEFDTVWSRIVNHAGEVFRQLRGAEFTYDVHGSSVIASRTNRQLARSQFEQAFARMPTAGPGALQDLQGPSYLWAILSDSRISGNAP